MLELGSLTPKNPRGKQSHQSLPNSDPLASRSDIARKREQLDRLRQRRVAFDVWIPCKMRSVDGHRIEGKVVRQKIRGVSNTCEVQRVYILCLINGVKCEVMI